MKDAMFLFPCCHYLFYGVCVWQLLIEMSIRNVFFFLMEHILVIGLSLHAETARPFIPYHVNCV